MIGVRNCFNSVVTCTVNTLGLCAKVVGTTAATYALSSLINRTGLGGPVTALAKRMQYLSTPFVDFSIFVNKKISKAIPPLFYDSKYPPSVLLGDDTSLIGNCSQTQRFPPLYHCQLAYEPILAGIPEEVIFRGILQQKILPWVGNRLPPSIGNILKNKVTRILLTSLLFAAGHENENLSNQFASGIVWGIVAETSQNLIIPILSHIFNNAGLTLFLAAALAYGEETD